LGTPPDARRYSGGKEWERDGVGREGQGEEILSRKVKEWGVKISKGPEQNRRGSKVAKKEQPQWEKRI